MSQKQFFFNENKVVMLLPLLLEKNCEGRKKQFYNFIFSNAVSSVFSYTIGVKGKTIILWKKTICYVNVTECREPFSDL